MPGCVILLWSIVHKLWTINYLTFVLSSGFLYILSPGLTLNALYHASILVIGALVRYCSGECGSVRMRCAAASGRCELLQTCAHERKKRWSGVNPSIFLSEWPSLVFLKAA